MLFLSKNFVKSVANIQLVIIFAANCFYSKYDSKPFPTNIPTKFGCCLPGFLYRPSISQVKKLTSNIIRRFKSYALLSRKRVSAEFTSKFWLNISNCYPVLYKYQKFHHRLLTESRNLYINRKFIDSQHLAMYKGTSGIVTSGILKFAQACFKMLMVPVKSGEFLFAAWNLASRYSVIPDPDWCCLANRIPFCQLTN